mmetsp:Transcript_2097/g.5126  ORF Transcript_2097/g.5126 Transcript_2097/m.5126 type:complete len:564 (-) Transcript_2097:387-2078(-)
MAGRKIFVGSLPANVTDAQLRVEFGKYGQVEDVFVKPNCEPTRQWAFITFASSEQAQFAKEACDRILVFPGHDRACDVMLAKHQGMFGQNYEPGHLAKMAVAAQTEGWGANAASPLVVAPPSVYQAAPPMPSSNRATKIFVGSLPDGISEAAVRAEFSKYGIIEEIFVKSPCEPGRQWAFVNYSTHEQASHAQEMTNGTLMFPGSLRPCEVTLARNQGLFGQEPLNESSVGGTAAADLVALGGYGYQQDPMAAYASGGGASLAAPVCQGPRKIFVGSLPDGVNDATLQAEFSKYGQVVDIFMKLGNESGRHWAFVTFATPEQARLAKESCDRVLTFPGSLQPCEVTMARHQGLFGQDALPGTAPRIQPAQPTLVAAEGPKKIFVGSIPDYTNEATLKAEFSRYGQIYDVFLKQTGEPGRNWAFITFGCAEHATYAKEATDRCLLLPGAEKPCEVMLAKNQGKFGQAPLTGGGTAAPAQPVAAAQNAPLPDFEAQPPPPDAPPPPHLTAWRMYRTAAGLPYYHNHNTGVTQWECPPELQVPGAPPGAGPYGPPQAAGGSRYSPY